MGDAEWRFLAFRFDGAGGETLEHPDVPVTAAHLTRTLSSPDALSVTISPEHAGLKDATGRPLFRPYATGVWAECDGIIYGGGILTSIQAQGPDLTLTVTGLSSYCDGRPWLGARVARYGADPGHLLPWIWQQVQAAPGCDLGLAVDTVTTPARVGLGAPAAAAAPAAGASAGSGASTAVRTAAAALTGGTGATTPAKTDTAVSKGGVAGKATGPAISHTMIDIAHDIMQGQGSPAKTNAAGNATTQGTDEPWVLDPAETANLGDVLDELATAATLETREETTWGEGNELRHRLRVGRPLGRRHHNLRLAIGENVWTIPEVTTDAGDWASDVVVLGAGEGSRKVRARASLARPGRLRRVHVHSDAGLTRTAAAQAAADRLLRTLAAPPDAVASLTLLDSPSAPLSVIAPGDDVLVQGFAGWGGTLEVWVRVLSIEWDPVAAPDTATLDVIPVGKVNET